VLYDRKEGEGEEAEDPMSKDIQEPMLLTDDGAIGARPHRTEEIERIKIEVILPNV
jgi:hypothetical protein